MPLTYVECPRDSWQGLARQIPTEEKIRYLQTLLEAGFTRLDMGSFVSTKAVPQLADTEVVLSQLSVPEGADLLCIVANERGLERAIAAPNVSSVGYPLSVNDTFQRRNTNRSLEASWPLVETMLREARGAGLRFVVYLSMGFGNPYGGPWEPADTATAVFRLRELGVQDIALADTVGTATPERLRAVLAATDAPGTLGLHLHACPDEWQGPLEVALENGLYWFEGALAGVGGCPFAGDELVGNLPTELVLPWLEAKTDERLIRNEVLRELAKDAARLAARFY
jgi:hydroxymethylglutaryl-CoA lyase